MVFAVPSGALVADHDPVAATTPTDGEPKGSGEPPTPVLGKHRVPARLKGALAEDKGVPGRAKLRPGGSSASVPTECGESDAGGCAWEKKDICAHVGCSDTS